MNLYEEPKFILFQIYEDIIATSAVEDDNGLVNKGNGEGDGTDFGGWGF